jgi:hypothetical protein
MRLYVLAVGFALSATSNILADGPTFTTIDFPGAVGTQAWGITLSGDIAGWYVSADTATHGFLKSRGQFISIDFPGAAYTLVNGISPRGDIIGEYAATLTGSGPHHGFVLSKDGVFTTIDYPGATYTYALGMNSRGDVLGSYAFEANLNHTFVLSADPFSPGGRFKAIDDVPGSNVGGASATMAISIHGDDIVGGYGAGGVGARISAERWPVHHDRPGARRHLHERDRDRFPRGNGRTVYAQRRKPRLSAERGTSHHHRFSWRYFYRGHGDQPERRHPGTVS